MGDLTVGSVIAGLRIEAVAGQGGMGVVYRAFDPGLQRTVAVKVIAEEFAADPEFHERFRQEARSAAGIDHPHVVTVHWAGEDAGRLFLVMQYVAGTDLRALIADRGRVDPVLAVALVSQVASALDGAHAHGLVHRDVKPANILVAGSDADARAFLTDFGLTRPVDASRHITGTGFLVGTEAYMAPELFSGGQASIASDVYALGCVLFHALSGRVFPRGGGRTSLRDEVVDRDLALALDEVVRRALAVSPDDRFGSAGDLAVAARAALADAAHGDTRAPAPPPPSTAVGPGPSHPSLPPSPTGPRYLPIPTEVGPPSAPAPHGPAYAPVYPSNAVPAQHVALPPVEYPGQGSWPSTPPGYGQEPTRRSPRGAVALTVAAVVAAAVAGGLVLPRLLDRGGEGTPAASAPAATDSIVLAEVEDDGTSVLLSWTGPADLDYAVDIAEYGQAATTTLAGRTTRYVATIDPDRRYCFQVRATDGSTILSSNTRGLRGATCHTA